MMTRKKSVHIECRYEFSKTVFGILDFMKCISNIFLIKSILLFKYLEIKNHLLKQQVATIHVPSIY